MNQHYPLMDARTFAETDHTGLALDLDETLAWTIRDWISQLIQTFGPHEGLSAEEMMRKFAHSSNLPAQYQSEEAKAMMQHWIENSDYQESISPVPDSHEIIRRSSLKVAAYITARPVSVREGTVRWLEKMNLPKRPLIMRPPEVSHEIGTKWKAQVLQLLYPQVSGIIDDSHSLAQELSALDYPGVHYLLDITDSKKTDQLKAQFPHQSIIPVQNWRAFEKDHAHKHR